MSDDYPEWLIIDEEHGRGYSTFVASENSPMYIRADLVPGWHDMPAPPLERIIVAGVQPRSGNVRAYWWIYEDVADEKGVPIDHPNAVKWMRLPAPPTEDPK